MKKERSHTTTVETTGDFSIPRLEALIRSSLEKEIRSSEFKGKLTVKQVHSTEVQAPKKG